MRITHAIARTHAAQSLRVVAACQREKYFIAHELRGWRCIAGNIRASIAQRRARIACKQLTPRCSYFAARQSCATCHKMPVTKTQA